jgi:hypothetical protein
MTRLWQLCVECLAVGSLVTYALHKDGWLGAAAVTTALGLGWAWSTRWGRL